LSIILENITADSLLEWMAEPVEVDNDEYQEWKVKKKEEGKIQLKDLLKEPKKRDYVRGSDFRSYLSCARILFWNIHDPVIRQVYINKSTFIAIRKHEIIQERLEEKGWFGEFAPTRYLPKYNMKGRGHVDCLSPSKTFFLEIKHNRPVLADELQAAWYQYILDGEPKIVMLYRTRVTIIPNLSAYLHKYLPRVIGTIQHNVLPPLHPNFPKCRGTCDYASRCGRKRRIQMHSGTPEEWRNYFKQIGAWRE